MFSIDSIAGYRHHAAEQQRVQRLRDEQRLRWARFCAAWGYIGAAIQNGYRLEGK